MPLTKSDGCTLFPEGEWTSCCTQHDFEYSQGISRAKADADLRDCVIRCGYPKMAWLMWLGLRIAGYPRWWWGHRQARKALLKDLK